MAFPLRSHPLRSALFSALLASLAPAVSAQTAASPAQAVDLPAGPLGRSLGSFAASRGIALSYDPALTAGRQAPALRGNLGNEEALQRLLAGSGLRLLLRPDGSYTVVRADDEAGVILPPLRVVAQIGFPYAGGMTLDEDHIRRQPAGNGDITSLLKISPSVQFDDGQLASKTPGEIAPANISINGAPFWQNLFVVDGMAMNNDIDPGNSSSGPNNIPGRSQGLALDTDLLGEIRVYDSNVPAEYGGFNGGVVQADTRNPTRELSGKVSAQVARSEWTRYHIDPNDPDYDAFHAAQGNSNQPEFDKLITRASVEGYLSDDFGLMASFSRKESTIPTRNFGLSHTTEQATQMHDQRRRIDNVFVKGVWHINDAWNLDVSLTHAPEENRGYGSNAIHSQYTVESGGDSLNARLVWDAPLAQVEQQLSWRDLENSRDSETDYMRIWRPSVVNDWGSATVQSDGSYGHVDQVQETTAYQLKADWHPVFALGLEHRFQTGLEVSRHDVHYERLADFYSNVIGAVRATTWCDADDAWCSLGQGTGNYSSWAGQYIAAYTLTEAGRIAFDTSSWGVFLQDEMRRGNLAVRAGLRVDGDDYMDQTTVAPRLALDYDVFGDNRTHVNAGANRYYGRNLWAYRLNDGIAAMQVAYSRASQTADWVAGTRTANGAKFNQLDIPYNDELVLGISHVQWGTEFALKYVNRRGRDQISRAWGSQIGQPSTDTSVLASNYYTYYNGGKTDADIYSLTVTPQHELELWGSRTRWQAIFDWSDVISSGLTDYTASIGAIYVVDPIISYQGRFIRYSDRPADNYNRPWTLRLSTTTEIPRWHLAWSNFLRLRDGYRRIAATSERADYNGESVRVWDERTFGSALTWDMRLSWERPFGTRQAVFANLDVSNVLDRVVVSSADSDSVEYEIGRQFMLELGYRF